jgi:hypothetical protein
MDKTMNMYNFGNYPASINLAKILDGLGNKAINRKFSAIYADYRRSQKEILKVEDRRTYVIGALLFRNYALNTVYELEFHMSHDSNGWPRENFTKEMKDAFTHFNNVICTDHKEMIRNL